VVTESPKPSILCKINFPWNFLSRNLFVQFRSNCDLITDAAAMNVELSNEATLEKETADADINFKIAK